MLPAITSTNICNHFDYIEAIAFNFSLVDTPPALPPFFEIVDDETNHLGNLPELPIDLLCKRLSPPDRMHLALTCKILFEKICMTGNARWKDVKSLAAFQNLCRWIRDTKNIRHIDENYTTVQEIYLAWPENCLSMFNRPSMELVLIRQIRQDPSHLEPLLCTSTNPTPMQFVFSLAWTVLHRYGLPYKSLETFCKLVTDTFLSGRLSSDLTNLKSLLKQLRKDHPHYNFNEKLPAPLLEQLNAVDQPRHPGWGLGWEEMFMRDDGLHLF